MGERTYKRLKNYTTTIKPEKTIAEIEKMLSEYGATQILKKYDEKGRPISMAFMINTKRGEIPILLPAKIPQVLMAFERGVSKKLLPRSYSGNKEQAFKTGWRLLKDWLDVVLSRFNLDLEKPEEAFLAYLYDYEKEETLYEKLEKTGFQAIPYQKKDATK